ncbi:MAG: ATP-binding cassette domain-containing protein [Candidatus Woesearchaeota archaeon]
MNEAIIEIKGLTKKFNNFAAVDNISFSVNKGEIFAFLGPNGAGKTTTIKMLTTLLKPTKGYIRINGFDVLKNPDKVRNSFGIVFQDQSLDEELTAYENMYFHSILYKIPKKERKERIDRMLKLVELFDKRNVFVKNFSGGMKRRLEIARSLLHEPKIIFLDEPTLGLDPQTRYHIWEYIKKLNKNNKTTIFLTTHYIEEAERIADRVAVIDNGRIIIIETVEEIKKKTKSKTLEEAFIKLTGHKIREEEATPLDRMRIRRAMRRH